MIAGKGNGRIVTTRDHDEATKLLREFRTTYADALEPEMTNEQWDRASRRRRLVWRHPRQVSLGLAARLYGILAVYNEFRPGMIKALQMAFARDGITVTPGRDYSVVIFLHVPNRAALRERVEGFVRDNLNTDELSWEKDGELRLWWD